MRTTRRLFKNTKTDRKISMMNMKNQLRETLRDKLLGNKDRLSEVKEKFQTFRNKFCMSTGRVKPQEKINLNLAYGKSREFSSILSTMKKERQKAREELPKVQKIMLKS